MEKQQIISFIRDEMLTDPDMDADIAWTLAKVAEHDDNAYYLLSRWMKEISDFKRKTLLLTMRRYVG